MKDKVLIVLITRNNPILLQFFIESYEKRIAGYDNDIVILDGESTNLEQLKVLEKLSKKYKIQTVPNNRVEANYNVAWEQNKDYKFYFFLHDDSYIIKDGWLKLFVDKMNSGYCEDIIKGTEFEKLPIGKVAQGTQPWRDYQSILGYPVQCIFLKYLLNIIRPGQIPSIFRYCDCDRVLISNECITATNGFRHIGDFWDIKEKNKILYDQLCQILNKYLPYPDEGSYPLDKYPPGECWRKFSLSGEFMSSIDPLIKGFRTVGVSDDGYLEQVDGFDVPKGHDVVLHLGSPNFREFVAKKLNSDREEVRKYFNNKVFVLKCLKMFKDYLERKSF
jgi:glycosyltransferase involved in cell wall biosynthesis